MLRNYCRRAEMSAVQGGFFFCTKYRNLNAYYAICIDLHCKISLLSVLFVRFQFRRNFKRL